MSRISRILLYINFVKQKKEYIFFNISHIDLNLLENFGNYLKYHKNLLPPSLKKDKKITSFT
jgi:hypothetical protein